jgi:topoisomerase IV subunit A
VSRVKAGKAFMTIDEGAAPLVPMPMLPDATRIACLSGAGRLLVFGLDEMKTLSGGGRGVTLMALDEKEPLTQALAIGKAGLVLLGTGRGGKAYEETLAGAALTPHIGKRARKGRAPDTKLKLQGMRPALPA